MEKEKLRALCKPLMNLETVEDCRDLLNRYIDFMFKVMKQHHYDPVDTQAKADAKIIFQMVLTKALNVQNMLNGVEYNNGQYKLNNIIDPTILFTLVRNIFETLCAFELVNVIPDTDDKRTIIYNLYKLSGLNYRKRFNDETATPAMQSVFAQEELEIEESIKLIKDTDLYKSLDAPNKSKIDNAIKGKNYQLRIDSVNNVKSYGWGDIPSLFGASHLLLKNVYTLFSLNAHPSYVSMFQFRDMFPKNDPEYVNISLSCMYYCFSFLSIFLADYIRLFPNIKATYMELSLEDQILLNFHNRLIRGESYSICDSWKQLNS